jgi:hypothetical protein
VHPILVEQIHYLRMLVKALDTNTGIVAVGWEADLYGYDKG